MKKTTQHLWLLLISCATLGCVKTASSLSQKAPNETRIAKISEKLQEPLNKIYRKWVDILLADDNPAEGDFYHIYYEFEENVKQIMDTEQRNQPISKPNEPAWHRKKIGALADKILLEILIDNTESLLTKLRLQAFTEGEQVVAPTANETNAIPEVTLQDGVENSYKALIDSLEHFRQDCIQALSALKDPTPGRSNWEIWKSAFKIFGTGLLRNNRSIGEMIIGDILIILPFTSIEKILALERWARSSNRNFKSFLLEMEEAMKRAIQHGYKKTPPPTFP